MAQSDYIPNEDDVLRCRDRTSGVVCEKLTLQKITFDMYDVGGQRSERKHWVKVFDGVKGVLFIVAISEVWKQKEKIKKKLKPCPQQQQRDTHSEGKFGRREQLISKKTF